jgi:hypothetical protein
MMLVQIGKDCLADDAEERRQTMNFGDVYDSHYFDEHERGTILHEV